MLSLIISTSVFFIAAWYLNRHLDGMNIAKGLTRSIVVFVLAWSVSWASGELVDWTQAKIEGPQAAAQPSGDLSKLIKLLGQTQQ